MKSEPLYVGDYVKHVSGYASEHGTSNKIYQIKQDNNSSIPMHKVMIIEFWSTKYHKIDTFFLGYEGDTNCWWEKVLPRDIDLYE